VVGNNLRRLRTERGWSLESFAKRSSVSRAMLGQIELGQSTPTINVLWKVAQALGLPFSALLSNPSSTPSSTRVMRSDQGKRLRSEDGGFTSRALFPHDVPGGSEFYELTLVVGGIERAEAHAPGTRENLVVAQGAMVLEVGEESHSLGCGDAIAFAADKAHVYRQQGPVPAQLFLVMTYT
jgi:transcriptional regulator with XRE-family HTH domain